MNYLVVPIEGGTNEEGKNILQLHHESVQSGSFQYLHGGLQDESGYDCFNWLGEPPQKKGIYSVKVLFQNRTIDAFAYIWFPLMNEKPRRRGLIVSKTDPQSYHEYAFKKWLEDSNVM